jgi:farnesol dehydrogenase
MKVLVTGGTGFLGSAIVRALEARGHQPVVFARSAGRADGRAGIAGDVRDRAAVLAAARGCDGICHTAALVSVWRRRRADFDEVNVVGLRNVIGAAAELKTGRVVYTSSFLALPPNGYEQPCEWNDYQRTKVAADREALRAAGDGVPLVIVYPGVVYGPGPLTEGNLVGRMIADHLAGRLPGLLGASRLWSYSFIDDVAQGHVRALESGRIGERYLLCGENAPQMRVFELVREQVGGKLPRRIPVAAATAAALVEYAGARVLGRVPMLTPGVVRILACDWAFESTLAERDLGYHPRPLASGLGQTLPEILKLGRAGISRTTTKGPDGGHSRFS